MASKCALLLLYWSFLHAAPCVWSWVSVLWLLGKSRAAEKKFHGVLVTVAQLQCLDFTILWIQSLHYIYPYSLMSLSECLCPFGLIMCYQSLYKSTLIFIPSSPPLRLKRAEIKRRAWGRLSKGHSSRNRSTIRGENHKCSCSEGFVSLTHCLSFLDRPH